MTAAPVIRAASAGASRRLVASVVVAGVLAASSAAALLGLALLATGLLIVGPCCVVLTGRWVPTALTGLWVIALAVVLGLPDGIWGTAVFFIWLSAVAVVAFAST